LDAKVGKRKTYKLVLRKKRKPMRYLIILIILIQSCTNSQLDKIDSRKNILDRAKNKDRTNDTIRFNSFSEYLQFIPDLVLPAKIDTYIVSNQPDSISWFLFRRRCNYGAQSCSPLFKIQRNDFVAIVFNGRSSGDELLMFTYNLDGNAIDSSEIYEWEGIGPIKEECHTTIDLNLKIHMLYKGIRYKSYDSPDTLKTLRTELILKILDDGKIQILKKTDNR
jgi:hypothetical protein